MQVRRLFALVLVVVAGVCVSVGWFLAAEGSAAPDGVEVCGDSVAEAGAGGNCSSATTTDIVDEDSSTVVRVRADKSPTAPRKT